MDRLKAKFPYTSHCTNPGYLLSPVTVQRNLCGENASVKVSIEIEGFQLPVTFTCDGRFGACLWHFALLCLGGKCLKCNVYHSYLKICIYLVERNKRKKVSSCLLFHHMPQLLGLGPGARNVEPGFVVEWKNSFT